ncbi:MAG: hypothetical protein M5R36_07505 [Deltaproteobacteria bacterium]|nr:hypothetical protein [Deltaproteobacteria bacterium]
MKKAASFPWAALARLLVFSVMVLLFGVGAPCDDDDDNDDSSDLDDYQDNPTPTPNPYDCSDGGTCGPGKACINSVCQDVCVGNTPTDMLDGSPCDDNDDCVSFTCDHDQGTQSTCTCLGSCDPGDYLRENRIDGWTFDGQYVCWDNVDGYCEGPVDESFTATQWGTDLAFTADDFEFTGTVCGGVYEVEGWPDDNSYIETGTITFDTSESTLPYRKETAYWYSGLPTGDPDGVCFATGILSGYTVPPIEDADNPCP